MQNKPVVGVFPELLRDQPHQFFFDFTYVLTWSDAGPVGNAENMRIDGDSRFTESRIQYDIGRFASHAGEMLELCSGMRNLALMFFQQESAGPDDILCLVSIKADGLNESQQFFLPEPEHCLRRICEGEKFFRREVDALVGRLRREDDCNQQFKRRVVNEFGGWVWIGGAQAREDLGTCRVIHRFDKRAA